MTSKIWISFREVLNNYGLKFLKSFFPVCQAILFQPLLFGCYLAPGTLLALANYKTWIIKTYLWFYIEILFRIYVWCVINSVLLQLVQYHRIFPFSV